MEQTPRFDSLLNSIGVTENDMGGTYNYSVGIPQGYPWLTLMKLRVRRVVQGHPYDYSTPVHALITL